MRRACTLVGVMVVALIARAPVAHAATTGTLRGGEVKALSVVPASGRTEVVVAVGGSVDVVDFALASPPMPTTSIS